MSCLFPMAQAIECNDIELIHGDCLEVMQKMSDKSIDLIYADPPYYCSTDRVFGCHWDSLDDYLRWMKPILKECHRILKSTGSIYVHLDWHVVHYVKILMDKIFKYSYFINEIIWCYSGGASQKKTLAKKHDTILFYAKSKNYQFNADSIRVPYRGDGGYQNSNGILNNGKRYYPNLKGKIPEDYWLIPIIHPNNKIERTGYPTQKPERLLGRIIKMASNKNDMVLDPFAGSGTTGRVCKDLDRNCILIDNRKEAIRCMEKRLGIRCT